MSSVDELTYGWAPHKDHCYLPVQVYHTELINTHYDVDITVTPVPHTTTLNIPNNPFKIPASLLIRTSLQAINAWNKYDDLTALEALDEPAVLHTIRMRYINNYIYSWIGKSVLISVNPYKQLPVFSSNVMQEYMEFNNPKKEAHLFAAANYAFSNLLKYHKTKRKQGFLKQAFIVSGESGAGKTEANKLLLQYFSEATDSQEGTGDGIVQSAPLLEAFGNSKTIRNDNSSRFGKWMEIGFKVLKQSKSSSEVGAKIASTRIISYLLEKSRVVSQAKNERNYHCFYQLCEACQKDPLLKKKYYLEHAKTYNFLNKSDCYRITGISDEVEFDATVQNLVAINFSSQEIDAIWKVLAAILHLGNIKITAKDAGAAGELATIGDDDALILAAELLSLHFEALRSALTTRDIGIGSLQRLPLDVKDAHNGRESLAKALYQSLFAWIVDKINSFLLDGEKANEFKEDLSTIGVLDIFGFEIFDLNSFEQFCINYANEKLQLYFTDHILQNEQEEYKREGVSFDFVNFQDNRDCTEMIDGKFSIFALLEEECMVPKGSDLNLRQKIDKQLSGHRCFGLVKKSPTLFEVHHYAGDVSYDVSGFLQKNRDSLQGNLSECVTSTSNLVLKEIFSSLSPLSEIGADIDSPRQYGRMRFAEFSSNIGFSDGSVRSRKVVKSTAGEAVSEPDSSRQFGSLHLSDSPPNFGYADGTVRSRKTIKPVSAGQQKLSLSKQFRTQLNTLMLKLESSEPVFVRCLKPNQEKKQDFFQAKCVLSQMKQTGLFEAVRIRASGYAFRMNHADFVRQYATCFPADQKKNILEMQVHSACTFILENIKRKDELQGVSVGKTKVFMQSNQRTILFQLREDVLHSSVVKIQSLVRKYLARRRFQKFIRVLHSLENTIEEGSYAELEELIQTIEEMPLASLIPLGTLERLNSRRRLLRVEQIFHDSIEKALSSRNLIELEKLLVDCKMQSIVGNSFSIEFKNLMKEAERIVNERNEEDVKRREREQNANALATFEDKKTDVPSQRGSLVLKVRIPTVPEGKDVARPKIFKQKFAHITENMNSIISKGRSSLIRDKSKAESSSASSNQASSQTTASSLVLDDYFGEKLVKPPGNSSSEVSSLEDYPPVSSIHHEEEKETSSTHRAVDKRRITVLADLLAETIKTKGDGQQSAHVRLNFRQAAKSIDGMQEVRLERDRLATRMEQIEEELRIIQGLILECDCILEESNMERLPEFIRRSIAIPESISENLVAGVQGNKSEFSEKLSSRIQDNKSHIAQSNKARNQPESELVSDIHEMKINSQFDFKARGNLSPISTPSNLSKESFHRTINLLEHAKPPKIVSNSEPVAFSAPGNAFSFLDFPRASAWHVEALGSASILDEKKNSDNLYIPVRYYYDRFFSLKDKYKISDLEFLRDPLSFSKHALFHKKRHQETMHTFSNTAIPTSLIHFSLTQFQNSPNPLKKKRETVKKAISLFHDITNYMNPVYHSYGYANGSVCSILHVAVNEEFLRDEIFLQIIKQTTDNPNDISKNLGFKLMLMCLCTFAPVSVQVKLVLESHIAKNSAILVNKFVGLDCVEDTAAHCWEALESWSEIPASRRCTEPLTMDQVTAITKMKSNSLIVLIEGRPVEIYVPSIPPEARDKFVYELKTGPVQSQELCVELARRFNLNYVGRLRVTNAPKWLQGSLIDNEYLPNSSDIYSTIEALKEEGAFETVTWEFVSTEQLYRPELILSPFSDK